MDKHQINIEFPFALQGLSTSFCLDFYADDYASLLEKIIETKNKIALSYQVENKTFSVLSKSGLSEIVKDADASNLDFDSIDKEKGTRFYLFIKLSSEHLFSPEKNAESLISQLNYVLQLLDAGCAHLLVYLTNFEMRLEFS